jgi:predicted RNA-binding Zn-ribbon protein involved in translation (DUF1610 family)
MGETETVKLTVKGVILLTDAGVKKLIREYTLYKRVLIPRVRQAVRQVIKDKNIKVYSQQKYVVDKKLAEYLKNLPFHPMPFQNQSYWIEKKDGQFWVHVKTKESEATCLLRVSEKYKGMVEKACGRACPYAVPRCEFPKCPFGTPKMCDKINPHLGEMELIEDKRYGWINCYITLRLPKPEPYEPKGWLGVDVGWNKLATSILATCNPHLTFSRPTFHGKEFKTRIIQLRHLLKETQRKGRAVKMWNNRLRNTTKYAVGTVAKEIVSKAKRLKAGVAMEKLTFKSVSKGYLVPRYRLMIAIKTLCEREGVPFKLVPAQYTSITCPKCGYVDDGNRNGERFTCRKCGYQADADIVGAMNIALKVTDAQMEGVMRGGSPSALKPRKAGPSKAGCVAQPKAAMRNVLLKRAAKSEVKKLEEWLKIEKEA